MKLATTMLCMAPLWAQLPARPAAVVTPAETSGTARLEIKDAEKHLDTRMASLGGATDPVDIVGLTRGLYLPGYGAVFTAELSLIPTPAPTPFHVQFTKQEIAQIHKRKLEHLQLLRPAMKGMWQDAAASLASMPDSEQIVLAVRLFYRPWEDTTGLPTQILLKGTRGGGVAAIQMEEQ
jgi:hypothetical protein